ncbi:hypothetical protein PMM47T1_27986 [Pseudomonas sp. M47T1]|nr:hypothetical protein PMM47T1_27986 [Pseudomonas sp. M47T1]
MMLAAIGNEGEAKLDAFLEEAVAREVLYLRFEEYRRFADAYQCPLDCSGNSSAERRVELADGRAIRFVRLNSALICSRRKDEKGNLLLGARQRVMNEAIGEELVVLTHHPLDWYADSAETKRFLRSRARVFISGHEHLAAVDVQNVEPGRDLMMLAAGATTPDSFDDTYTYAYNIIQFDWDENDDALAVTLYARAWTISHGAVPAVQWQPMTMAFSVTEDQLKGLTAGDRVSFSFRLEGGRATIVSIKK